VSRKLLLSLLLLLLPAGCLPRTDAPEKDSLPAVTAPTVEVAASGAHVFSFDPPGSGARVLVQVPVEVTNPGSRQLELHGFRYSARLGGTAGQALSEKEHGTLPLRLGPGASIRLSLLLSGNLRNDAALLRDTADSFRDGADGLPWRVTGRLSFTADGHPFTEQQDVRLEGRARPATGPELPELRILEPESSAWSTEAEEAYVRLLLEVRNPGPAGYVVQGRDLRLHVEGEPLASEPLPPTPVAAAGTTVVPLLFRLEPGQLTPAARTALSDLLSGAPATVSVHGELLVDVLALDSYRLAAEDALTVRFNTD